MFIEVWSDIACPFCYLGKKNLEDALKELDFSVPVVWRSFELDPNAPKSSSVDLPTKLAQKYGKSIEWAKSMNQDLSAKAKDVGLILNFDKVVPTNTFDAHRLIHFAEAHGKQGEMKERLLKAYFTEGENLSERATLSRLAKDIGLDEEQASLCLDSEQYVQDVRDDEKLAADLEISGVPFFVVNQRYAISGAQPKDFFVSNLRKIKADLDQEEG